MDGLGALAFGNGGAAGPTGTLFFTADRTTKATACRQERTS